MGLISLSIQAALIVIVVVAACLARWRRNFRAHCLVMRVAVPLQIAAVAFTMWSPLTAYVRAAPFGLFFNVELLVHHGLGLVTIVLWLYINLVFLGGVRLVGRLKSLMWAAFFSWLAAFLIGLHIYSMLWV